MKLLTLGEMEAFGKGADDPLSEVASDGYRFIYFIVCYGLYNRIIALAQVNCKKIVFSE